MFDSPSQSEITGSAPGRVRRRVSFDHDGDKNASPVHTYSYHVIPPKGDDGDKGASTVYASICHGATKGLRAGSMSHETLVPSRLRPPRSSTRRRSSTHGQVQEQIARVLVTDATGALGSWVVRMLLETGRYHVIAAVSVPRRDYLRAALDAEQAIETLRSLPHASTQLTVCRVENPFAPDAYDHVVLHSRCDWVIHTALAGPRFVTDDYVMDGKVPTPALPSNSKNLVSIATLTELGTVNLMRACTHADSHVTRVVIPAMASVGEDEYSQGKAAGERAGRAFMRATTPRFTLGVVRTGALLGPVITASVSMSTANRDLAMLVTGFFGLVGLDIAWPITDIRDCATALIEAARATYATTLCVGAVTDMTALVEHVEAEAAAIKMQTPGLPWRAITLPRVLSRHVLRRQRRIRCDALAGAIVGGTPPTPTSPTLSTPVPHSRNVAHTIREALLDVLKWGYVRFAAEHTPTAALATSTGPNWDQLPSVVDTSSVPWPPRRRDTHRRGSRVSESSTGTWVPLDGLPGRSGSVLSNLSSSTWNLPAYEDTWCHGHSPRAVWKPKQPVTMSASDSSLIMQFARALLTVC